MRRTLHDYSPNATWQLLQGTESAIAGAGAGLVSATLTCPLDVVKTKLQAEGILGGSSPRYKGLFDTTGVIWTEEGFRGLYRGIGPTLIAYLCSWAVYFTAYDKVKAVMTERRNASEEDLLTHITAAMSAGALSGIATNPLWVIKTRFMTQRVKDGHVTRYRNTFDAISRIYKVEGFNGFYRGLLPSLLGVSHVAVQFPLYEHFKRLNRPADGSEISPPVILSCSASSKMIASIATYPHEVLRTRLQIQANHPRLSTASSTTIPVIDHTEKKLDKLKDVIAAIWRKEGIRGFYRGLSVNLVRTVPTSAITILTYEVLMRRLLPLTGGKRGGLNGNGHTKPSSTAAAK